MTRAQDADSGQTPPPSPPYVGALSGNFTLIKKFAYPPLDASATAVQKAEQTIPTNFIEVDAVKTGAIRKDDQHFKDGSGREIWRVQAYRFTVDLLHPDSVNLDYTGGPNDSPLLGRYRDADDFPELSWILGPTFQGIQLRHDKKCYVFKSGEQTAWIDTTTHLPVYFESKTMQVTYTYSDPPDEPLQLPKGYAEKLEKFKRALRGQF